MGRLYLCEETTDGMEIEALSCALKKKKKRLYKDPTQRKKHQTLLHTRPVIQTNEMSVQMQKQMVFITQNLKIT